MKNLSNTLRNLCLALALIAVGSFVTTRALGDDIPTFSDPDVTGFVKSYAQFVDDIIDAYKAAKAGDNSKATALQAKAPELQAKAAQIASGGKLKTDEQSKYLAFVQACNQKMLDALK
ncbi:MAG: hypothetical protein JOZ08_06475 [Verrucomicrobia bacterium]|nr:hypothetical protein [Verrucomicrobiota bacterium]MBV8275059.1 hypothetical protein [Verrucomicrobiota bacterium]